MKNYRTHVLWYCVQTFMLLMLQWNSPTIPVHEHDLYHLWIVYLQSCNSHEWHRWGEWSVNWFSHYIHLSCYKNNKKWFKSSVNCKGIRYVQKQYWYVCEMLPASSDMLAVGWGSMQFFDRSTCFTYIYNISFDVKGEVSILYRVFHFYYSC